MQVESRHPLTIALAEIAAGKIEPRMFNTGAESLGDSFESAVLGDDVIAGEFGMLLPALDENESVLIETIGLEFADPEVDVEANGDGELSLADLADGEEEEIVPVDSDEDTLSLSDIAEEEEALSDDASSDEV